MKVKKYLKIGKPAVKGSILVIFGILNSRIGIGVEIFTNNLIYGPIAYFFLALSGIIIIEFLHILNKSSDRDKKNKIGVLIAFGSLNIISLILITFNIIENFTIYYLNIPIILFTPLIIIFWIALGYFGTKDIIEKITVKILVFTLSFSVGLFYGVFLNTLIIPTQIYFFFLSISFLQMSRELSKGFNEKEKMEEYFQFPNRTDERKLLKFSLIFQFAAIIFLIIPVFLEIYNNFLLLFLMVSNLTVISIASFLTLASLIEKEIYKSISSILKIGILLELIMFLAFGF
ncbi:MAG: hypothetical protein ACFE9S_02985 [Candidatus Hermodarchaeota archaeon]